MGIGTVVLDEGWFSVQSASSPSSTVMLWGSAKTGDGYSYQAGSTTPNTAYDRAFALYEGGPAGEEYEWNAVVKYIYIEDEISAPVFLLENPLITDPNVDYTKPLIGESFEAFGIKLPFKGNYNKIEELVSSKILGNEEGVPNDAILRGVAINGMADIAVLQGFGDGFGDGVELWSPVSIFYFDDCSFINTLRKKIRLTKYFSVFFYYKYFCY